MDEKIKSNLKTHSELLIFISAFLTEIVFGLYLVSKFGTTFFDQDSASYLYNARNVIDNGAYSGLSALVGTWLPLFSLSQVPFIISNYMYSTGFSGTIVNAIATAGTCVFLYRILGGNSNRLAILGPAIFLSNIYVLLFGAIPMPEQGAVFFLVASAYYFKKYLDGEELKDFIKCSIVLIFGSLMKYEMWVVAIFVVLVFSFQEVLRKRQGYKIGYAVLPLIGIVSWIFANFMIHRNALWFYDNPGSALMQNAMYQRYFMGSAYLTLNHALIQMNLTVGSLVYVAVISLALLIVIGRTKWIILSAMLFIPSIVNVFLMYQGQSAGWQRYFYTQIPGFVVLTVVLFESASVLWNLATHNNLRKYQVNFHATFVMVSVIAAASIVVAPITSTQLDHDATLYLSIKDNRPWVYQGLGISNDRVFFTIENNKRTFVSDISTDYLNNNTHIIFSQVKNVIGNDKILMPSMIVSENGTDIRADMFSISEGVSPEQIIDGFDYAEYDRIMSDPWDHVKFVAIVPIDSNVNNNVSKFYSGKFYLSNYYDNQTWRTTFLDNYKQVIDNGKFQIFELKNNYTMR